MQRFKKVSLSDIISDHVTLYAPDPTTTTTNQPIVLLIGTISVASSPTQTILVNYPIPTGSIIFTDTHNVSILIEWPLFDSSLLNSPVLLHTFAFVPTTTREPSIKALPYLELHAAPISIPHDHILLKLWPTFSCREFDALKFIESSADLHVQFGLTETANSYRLTQIEQLSSTKRKLTSIEAILYAKSPLHLHKTPQFLLELVEFNKSGVMLNAFVIVTGTQFLESYYNLRPAHRILITNLKASKISKDGTTRKVWMSTDSTRFHNMDTGNQTEDVVDFQQSHSQTSIGEYMEHAQSQSQITSTGDRQLTPHHEVSPAQTPLSQSQSQSSQSAKPPPVITYSGTISAILDPSCGLYELDKSHLLTLVYYPAPLESYRQYRVGTTVQLHHVFVTQIRDSLIGGDLAQSKKKRAREEDDKPASAQNDGSKHDLNTRLCFVASYYSHIRVISFSQATKSESPGAAYMRSAIPRDILSLFDYYTSLYLSHLVRQFTTKFPSTPGIQQHHHMLSFYIRLLTRLYELPHPPKKMDRQLLDEFVDHPRTQILESPFRQNVVPVNIAEIKTVLSLLDRYISHHIIPSVVETKPTRFVLNSCVHVIQTSLLGVDEPLLLCGLFRGSQTDGRLTLRDQASLPVVLASGMSDGDASNREKWVCDVTMLNHLWLFRSFDFVIELLDIERLNLMDELKSVGTESDGSGTDKSHQKWSFLNLVKKGVARLYARLEFSESSAMLINVMASPLLYNSTSSDLTKHVKADCRQSFFGRIIHIDPPTPHVSNTVSNRGAISEIQYNTAVEFIGFAILMESHCQVAKSASNRSISATISTAYKVRIHRLFLRSKLGMRWLSLLRHRGVYLFENVIVEANDNSGNQLMMDDSSRILAVGVVNDQAVSTEMNKVWEDVIGFKLASAQLSLSIPNQVQRTKFLDAIVRDDVESLREVAGLEVPVVPSDVTVTDMLQWYPSVSGSSDLLPNGVSSTLFNLTGVILDVSIRESSTSVLSSPSFSSTSSPTKAIVQPQSLLSSVTSSTKSNVILHPRVLYLKLLDPIDKVNIIDAYLDCPDFISSYPMGLIPGSLIQINSVSIKFVGGVARYCIGNVSSSIRILAASIPRSSHCDNDTTAARPLQDDIVQYHLLPLTYLSQLLDPLQSNHTVSKFCVFVTHIQHISIKAICSSCCSPIQNDTVGCGVTWCRYYRSRSALSPSISNPTPSIQNNQDRIKFEAECKLSISDGSFGGVVVFIKGEENVSCLLNVSLSSKEWKMVRIEATRNGGLMFTGKEGISDSKSDQPNTSAPTKPNRSITFDRLCSSALSFLKWNQLFIYGTHSNFPSPSMPSSSASSSSLPKGISSRTIKMDGGMKEITTLARDKPVMLQVVKVEKPNVVKEGWKMLLELGG